MNLLDWIGSGFVYKSPKPYDGFARFLLDLPSKQLRSLADSNAHCSKKRGTIGVCLTTDSNIGTIIKVIEKHNKRDRICYYYGVKWPDGRRSEHAQHILVPAP
jgi:hypothetical protein